MDESKDPKIPMLSKNTEKVFKIVISIILIYVVITMFGINIINENYKTYFKENGELIITLVIIVFSMIVLFSIYNIKLPSDHNKKLINKVIIESFNNEAFSSNNIDSNTNSILDNDNDKDKDVMDTFNKIDSKKIDVAFCSNKSSEEKDKNCKNLMKNNCTIVDCCILLDGDKCVGGDESGPTYLNKEGKDVDFQYYNYRDTCIGKCPSGK